MNRLRSRWRWLKLAGAFGALLAGAAHAQEKLAAYREFFDRETNPVRKAKLFQKLGRAQFRELRRAADALDYTQVDKTLDEYLQGARKTLEALRATGADAERKPGGFKELQISLREGLRQLDEILLGVPEGPRVPLEARRNDIAKLNKELIDKLFPHQPEKHTDKKTQGVKPSCE